MIELTPADLLAVQRAGFLVGPLLVAFILLLATRPTPRMATAAMVGFLWQFQALLLLNIIAGAADWWHFNAPINHLASVPIDVWIGWAVWWGPVAVFLNRWVPIWQLVVASFAIDLITMPMLTPLVELGDTWLIGEAAAIGLCLLPGLYASKLTLKDRNPRRRAMFHVLGWGGYMVVVLPVSALAYEGISFANLYHVPVSAIDWALIIPTLFLLFIGIAATAEFARAGNGTPIPYDPPKTVVTTGPYAFNANPMQIISAAVMAMLALYAGSWALAFIAAMFLVFDAIYAAQYNREHIERALPHDWSAYKESVKDWRIRWRPHIHSRAQVIISSIDQNNAFWKRLWPKISSYLSGTFDVSVKDHRQVPRLVYCRPDAQVEDIGIHAVGRILEHGPLPMAMIGWLFRFPYLGGALQRISGLMILVYRRYRGA